MRDRNEVNLMGRLGRDAEYRVMQSGSSVTSLSVATKESWKDKTTGEWKDRTEWHKITVWGKTADRAKDLRKGDPVTIRGSLQTRKWTGQDGQDKYSTEIHVKDFEGWVEKLADDRAPRQEQPAHSASGFDDASEIPF